MSDSTNTPTIRSSGRRGHTVVPNWRWEDPSLDTYALRIAGWLASHADSFMGRVTRNLVAQKTGVSHAKATDSLRKLEELGIIVIETAPSAGNDRWVITFDWDVWERSPDDRYSGHDTTASGHVATTSGMHLEDQVEEASETPTPGQNANKVVRDYFQYVELQTGKAFKGVKFVAMVKLVTPFLESGWTVLEVKGALKRMRDQGKPILSQVIQEQLENRGNCAAPPPKREYAGEAWMSNRGKGVFSDD